MRSLLFMDQAMNGWYHVITSSDLKKSVYSLNALDLSLLISHSHLTVFEPAA